MFDYVQNLKIYPRLVDEKTQLDIKNIKDETDPTSNKIVVGHKYSIESGFKYDNVLQSQIINMNVLII